MENKSKKIGLYIAIGTVALIGICASVLAITKKCEKCKDY